MIFNFEGLLHCYFSGFDNSCALRLVFLWGALILQHQLSHGLKSPIGYFQVVGSLWI